MSKVSRSVYQKVKEENKRLLADIRILTGLFSAEKLKLIMEWRKKFREEVEFNQMIKEIVTGKVLSNPEEYPDYLVDKAKENQKLNN